jgi:hypothetical protein
MMAEEADLGVSMTNEVMMLHIAGLIQNKMLISKHNKNCNYL